MTWNEQLLPEQKPAVDFICSRPGTLLLGDTGVGKTYITLAALERLAPQMTLLVVPLTSLDVVWMPKLATLEGFTILRDPSHLPRGRKNASTALPRAGRGPLRDPSPPKVILLLHMEAFSKHSARLQYRPWDFVVIDESQVLKARASGFSRAARRLRKVDRRLALSATPIDKTPIDLFGQMRFVDHSILGESFTPFKEEFCVPSGWKGYKLTFRESKMPKLMRLLQPVMFRLTKAFQNLPPLTIIPVPLPLLGAQRKLYREMDEHRVTQNPSIIARLAVTKQVKLEQIAGGTVIDDNDERVIVGYAKERKLRVIVKKLAPPFVVFCKYLHEIPMIQAVLEERLDIVKALHGGIKGQERTDLINDFQANHIDGVVCQVKTGGVSVEFTRANTLVFYSFGFSFINFEQILGRVHRGGQTRPVTVFLLHAVNTVEDEIIATLEDKRDTFFRMVSLIDMENPPL